MCFRALKLVIRLTELWRSYYTDYARDIFCGNWSKLFYRFYVGVQQKLGFIWHLPNILNHNYLDCKIVINFKSGFKVK